MRDELNVHEVNEAEGCKHHVGTVKHISYHWTRVTGHFCYPTRVIGHFCYPTCVIGHFSDRSFKYHNTEQYIEIIFLTSMTMLQSIYKINAPNAAKKKCLAFEARVISSNAKA